MNFGNLEKIEELILRPSSKFSIKNTVVLGRIGKNGNRVDCFKENCYKSNKYVNYQYVGTLYMESSDFLVFSCKDNDSNKINEIYSSYQHIEKIRNGFNNIVKNMDEAFTVYGDGTITLDPKYESYIEKINGLVGNHCIQMIYEVIYDENKVSNQYEKGVTIFFNEENYYTTITEDELQGITYFLNNFNLLSSSQHLKQMAYMHQIANALELESVEMLPVEYSYGSGGKIANGKKRNFKKISKDNETDEIE